MNYREWFISSIGQHKMSGVRKAFYALVSVAVVGGDLFGLLEVVVATNEALSWAVS